MIRRVARYAPDSARIEPDVATGRILIVGSPVEETSFMAMALRRRDHAVKCVVTATEALHVSERERFDVVIARDVLADGSGRALLVDLQQRHGPLRTVLCHDGEPPRPSVVPPAPASASVAAASNRFAPAFAGIDGFLRRPVPVVALAQTVERLLSHAQPGEG